MARHCRLDFPGIAQHVVQRGNNRLPCFLDDKDRRIYLHMLRDALVDSGCLLHAYVLMDNHVHLLVTPPLAGAVSRLMQHLGRRYVGCFNRRHGRTGTLWEGRYKACLVDDGAYVMNCHRYIELNPVRAAVVGDPLDWPWSSCTASCGLSRNPLLTPHPAYDALAETPRDRAAVYRAMLQSVLDEPTLAEIRVYLQQQRAFGRDGFRAMVAAKVGRYAGVRPAHRPRREARASPLPTIIAAN